ncbi:uncharacterized protein LOC133929288 [Phragmites australis]|uniref:uncharacterized protein LOC133929288 n=1 Tax=Phragmites australis TaxID=29695 RepID=UPI002D76D91C|nr:uncharacterized protein LOC133929288 [Phragmites australis]
MQKSQGAKSTARRRPLRVLSSNKARRASESLRCKPPPPAAAADAALDRLLLARSDLASIVSQIDELISDALQCQTMPKRGKQEIESFSGFLSDTNSSLKQWSSRLKQALENCPVKVENVSKHTLGTCSNSAAKGYEKLICSSSNLLDPVATPSCNLLNCSSSNLPEADMIVSPSPLVSWRTGACMVESGKQLFLLTPLPKTKACSLRCPTSKTQVKTTSSMDQRNLPSLPVWKLTISDDDHPDLEQGVKVNEARTGTVTPHVTTANKGSLVDRLRSPCTFSIQKSTRALPDSCLNTSLSSKQQLFSPILEGSRKEDAVSDGPTQGDKRSETCEDLSSSDEVSKDLASRYDLYGFNRSTKNTHRRREADDTLQWFLSPLKTCVLLDPSDDKPIPTPAGNNKKGKQDVSDDDKTIQTPAAHSKALLGTPWKGLESTNLKGRRAGETTLKKELGTPWNGLESTNLKGGQAGETTLKKVLGTPWKGLESTNLKGRQAGETTLKKELWTRFEAVSTNELHFDKSVFQKTDGRRFLDMLEEAS